MTEAAPRNRAASTAEFKRSALGDPHYSSRAALLRILTIGAGVWAVFAVQYAAQARPRTASLDVVAMLLTLAFWWGARRARSDRSLRALWHGTFAVNAMALTIAATWSGHSNAMALWWLALIPYLAGLQLGVRQALIWTFIALMLVAGVHLLEHWAPQPTEFLVQGPELYAGQLFFAGVLAVFGVASRRKADAQQLDLSRSNERLRAVIDRLDDAVVVSDEDFTIVVANLPAARILGATDPRLVSGLDLLPLVHFGLERAGYDADAEVRQMHQMFRNREHRQHDEYDLGFGRIYERGHQPVELEGGRPGSLWTFRDITERKQMDRLKDDFVSVVSHELRTPLTSIHGALRLMEGGALGTLDDKAKKVLKIAVGNSERLRVLIDDLLDMQRIRRGDFALETEPVPAALIVADAIDASTHMAQRAEITLVEEITRVDGEPVCVADRQRAAQVLINLCSNAIKFSPRASEVRVRVEADPSRVRFEVVDRGPGIPQQEIERLFMPFEQLDARSERAKGGSGLGLAIARAIVEAHDGELGVDSRVDEGSTFWFELPSASVAAEPSETTAD